MRTGIFTIQQTLSADAATILKQAVSLARRRGHSQVTPLHVASAMLASSTGLLRKACLRTHSHPLQCKALELCFNVALNRLPASTSCPLLGPHSPHSSLSNALVAAFKRAQANQRRGSMENQQQPILALKIELEPLVVSMLDDPSVNRVMREAGFSSTQVKIKVEEAVSLEISSHSPPISIQSKENSKPFSHNVSQSLPFNQSVVIPNKSFNHTINDDVNIVLSALVNKRRNTIIVGECLGSTEEIARRLMDKFEKGDVPSELRYVQLISFPLYSLKNLSKDDVEQKLEEFRCHVKSYLGRGVVLYIGDLEWISEFWSSYGDKRRDYYCRVEHIVMELRRLVCGIVDNDRIMLLGFATLQIYMRCKTGHFSLESIWDLHPLNVPVCNLDLSLTVDSESGSSFTNKVSKDDSNCPIPQTGSVDKNLNSCRDLSVNFDRVCTKKTNLPLWLQKYKEEKKSDTTNDQDCVEISDVCKNWPAIFEPKQSPKQQLFWTSENSKWYGSKLTMFKPEIEEDKPEILSNPNSSPNSASSSEVVEETDELPQFTELNAENIHILYNALENKAPNQKDVIPEIVSSILQCRSGKGERKEKLTYRDNKKETWLFFLGSDTESKEKIAREIAKLVFGSPSKFVSVCLSSFSLTTSAYSSEESKNKRVRDELGCSYLDRFCEAVNENPRRVFFMEDLEEVDNQSQKGIMRAMASGELTLPGGEIVLLKDAIIIFSSESISSVSKRCSPHRRKKNDRCGEECNDIDSTKRSLCLTLDLNIAIQDDHGDEDLVGDIEILESVDRKIVLNVN